MAGVTVMPAVVPARLRLLRVPVITACRLSARSMKSMTARQSGIFHRTQGAEGAPLALEAGVVLYCRIVTLLTWTRCSLTRQSQQSIVSPGLGEQGFSFQM